MSTVNWLQALAGATLGLLLGSLLSDPLKRVWSALGQALTNRSVRRIEGHWESVYWYLDDQGQKREHHDAIHLIQRGVYVVGKNEGPTDHRYQMEGIFRDQAVLSGTWKSQRPDSTYHGTFQVVVNADGRKMKGKWLGLANNGSIRDGEWYLTKRS